jgi:hypothetical protein
VNRLPRTTTITFPLPAFITTISNTENPPWGPPSRRAGAERERKSQKVHGCRGDVSLDTFGATSGTWEVARA